MDFDTRGHDIFRRWYVDGRIFYHKVIDKKSPRKGIVDFVIKIQNFRIFIIFDDITKVTFATDLSFNIVTS